MIVKSSHQLWAACCTTSLSERINTCFAKLLMSSQMNFLPDSEFNPFSIPSTLWIFPPAGSPAGKVHHHIVRSFSFFKTQLECHFLLEVFPGCFLSPGLTMPPTVVQSLSRVWLFVTPWTAACPSLSPGVCSSTCPLSQWCHPTISSSVIPFSSCPQSFPASESFQMS